MELLKSEWLSHSWPDCDRGNLRLESEQGGNLKLFPGLPSIEDGGRTALTQDSRPPLQFSAPKPIMAWATASSERLPEKSFIQGGASPLLLTKFVANAPKICTLGLNWLRGSQIFWGYL